MDWEGREGDVEGLFVWKEEEEEEVDFGHTRSGGKRREKGGGRGHKCPARQKKSAESFFLWECESVSYPGTTVEFCTSHTQPTTHS